MKLGPLPRVEMVSRLGETARSVSEDVVGSSLGVRMEDDEDDGG